MSFGDVLRGTATAGSSAALCHAVFPIGPVIAPGARAATTDGNSHRGEIEERVRVMAETVAHSTAWKAPNDAASSKARQGTPPRPGNPSTPTVGMH